MNTTLNPSMWGPPVVNKDGAAMRGHTTIPIMGGPSVPTLHQQAWSPPGHARPAFGGTAIMKRDVCQETRLLTPSVRAAGALLGIPQLPQLQVPALFLHLITHFWFHLHLLGIPQPL